MAEFLFRGLVCVTGVREHEVDKSKNKEKERKSSSGKKKVNSWKKFFIIDNTGRYTISTLVW